MGMISIRKCPFCGGAAKIWKGLNDFCDHEIICQKCSASGGCFNEEFKDLRPMSSNADRLEAEKRNRQAAVKHWNTRII